MIYFHPLIPGQSNTKHSEYHVYQHGVDSTGLSQHGIPSSWDMLTSVPNVQLVFLIKLSTTAYDRVPEYWLRSRVLSAPKVCQIQIFKDSS